MFERTRFFIQGLRHPKQVGTIVSCSPYIGSAMASYIDPMMSGTYIEFGGGQGVITREILRNIPADSILLSFEINPNLCKDLEKIQDRDPRLKVIKDSAENLEYHLLENPKPPILIISTLPLATLKDEEKIKILTAASYNLESNPFIQYQYFGQDDDTLRKYFTYVETVKLRRHLIPRGVIHVCRN